MGVELVREPRVQVVDGSHGAQPRDVEVDLLEVAPQFRPQPRSAPPLEGGGGVSTSLSSARIST